VQRWTADCASGRPLFRRMLRPTGFALIDDPLLPADETHRIADTAVFCRELKREDTWARLHLVPIMLAEGDRDAFRRREAAKAREAEIMKDVKGWEVRRPASVIRGTETDRALALAGWEGRLHEPRAKPGTAVHRRSVDYTPADNRALLYDRLWVTRQHGIRSGGRSRHRFRVLAWMCVRWNYM
jgi:hypothetical protein